MTNCHQLKLVSQDGKLRLTDVVDIEGMFRIIESIPSKNTREQIEKETGKKIVSSSNNKRNKTIGDK